MWNLFSSNGSAADDLAKENKRLSEHLSIIVEDYELLKEAHRRVLEQMLPTPSLSPSSGVLLSNIEMQISQISAQLKSVDDSPISKTLRKLLEGDIQNLVLQCAKERHELSELREALRLKQEEMAEQEYDLSHALHELRCRETETTLDQAIQQNVELLQTVDSLKKTVQNKEREIAQLTAERPGDTHKEEMRLKRALKRVAAEVGELKARCSFEAFSKQLTSTKEFFATELQRLSRRVAGVFKEKQKLQERLDSERKSWRDTEAAMRANFEFELEQLQKRLNKTMASSATQTEHYFEEVDTQQSEMWGADFELDLTPEVPPEPVERTEPAPPAPKQSFLKKKPQAGSDDMSTFLSELT